MKISDEEFERIFKMPFDEALEYLRQKNPRAVENWNDLTDEEKYNAFWVAGLLQLDILQEILNDLTQAIETGASIQEFVNVARQKLSDSGWTGGNNSRLELIFLQNIQTAYQVGRWQKMQETKETRPFLQYVSVLDKGTTSICRGLDGAVFSIGSPVWDTIFPPNHFRCRSTVVSISRVEFESEGLRLSDAKLSADHAPADGFRFNPGKQPQQDPPTIDDYSKTLAAAFNKLIEGRE